MSSVIRLCLYELRLQRGYARVWLGYLTGLVLMLNEASHYIRYARELGEDIQVFEPFLVTVNNQSIVVFVVIGWMLVISSVPYIDSSSVYAVYRTTHKKWNLSVCLTIVAQAILYYVILLVGTIVISLPHCYFDNCWSYPLVRLASGTASATDIVFADKSIVDTLSLFSVFGNTFLLAILYACLLGLFTYAMSLAFSRQWGCVAGVLFHFIGFEVMKEGMGFFITYSMLARSIAVLQMGSYAIENLMDTYLLFFVGNYLLMVCAKWLTVRYDVPAVVKGDG